MSDWDLLQIYVKNRSETAFAELVRLHLDWVYSVALRQLEDQQLAEDVAQSVFVLLARKSAELRPGTLLGGWLFRTVCYVAGHARREQLRRKHREYQASAMFHDMNSPDTTEMGWQQLAPHLDQAVSALPETDRSAILLRFYEKMPLHGVGEKLGISEEAAKKRVGRALEKLRTFLERRGGGHLSGTALAAILADKAVESASASPALASAIVKASLASTACTLGELPQLALATLRAWRWARIKMTLALGTAGLALFFLTLNLRGPFTPPTNPTAGSFNDTPAAGGEAGVNPLNELPADNPTPLSRKTGAMTGWVMDESGRPIPGAAVWGGFESRPFATDVTDASGQFALRVMEAPSFVTVTAVGFAADQHQVDPATESGPLIFRLRAARPLRVRLVDESDQGVPGAKLYLAKWWGKSGTLGQYLPLRTDETGVLQWLSAPRGEMELQFSKAGYRYSRTNRLTADGSEYTIVLFPTATVTGSVTDAETGEPVATFRFTQGHSQPWQPSNPLPMWETRAQSASNGFYTATIEEEQVPYLRIEADGYETVETVISLNQGLEAVQNFALRRASATNSIRGIVQQPDGSPAAGVEVALCTAQVGVMLAGTAFEPAAFGNLGQSEKYAYRRRTDEQGTFIFEPRPGAHTVVAVGPAGVGRERCFDSSNPIAIQLQPWGRIEGTVRTRDGRWAGRKLRFRRLGNLTSWMTVFHQSDQVESDAAGKFTWETVPPGDGRVVIEDDDGTAPILSEAVQVNPGATVQVQVGGVGRLVAGRLIAPPEIEIRSWSNQVTSAQLKNDWDPYPLPRTLTGNAVERWKLEFEESDAGRAWLRQSRSYDFKVEPDGSFVIPEVLPGKYRLSISVVQGSLGSGPDRARRNPGDGPQIAWGGTKLFVAEAAQGGGKPMDIGEISLHATQ